MTQKECVQVVRAAGFSGYDKSLDSKANNPGKYGVQRTAEAQAALDAVATARNGGLAVKQCKHGRVTGTSCHTAFPPDLRANRPNR